MGVFTDGEIGLYCSAPSNKANYRSIGRGTGGVETRTTKRRSWLDPDQVTQPSIPGKFETVLYKGNKEDKGFGAGAPRFGQEARYGEQPGPGNNGEPPGMATLVIADKTVGKRGHGAFSSRTPRQKGPTGAVKPPGPGAYCAPTGPGASIPDKSSLLASSAFVPPSSVNPLNFNARCAPGPGDYSGAVGLYSANSSKPENIGAFVPREGLLTDRSSHAMTKNPAPGPGTYSLDVKHRRPTSARRQFVPPEGWETEFVPPKTETALARRATAVIAEDSPRKPTMPGPGQYDPKPEVASGGGKTHFSTGETQAFRVGNSHKARKWREQVPGPGDYEALSHDRHSHAASSAFSSSIQRFKAREALAPGPAYYGPPAKPDNDFHLNPQQSWV